MQVASPEQVILIALEFVLSISAETQRRAKEELRNSRVRCAKRCPTFALKINRGGPRNRLEISHLQIHRGKAILRTRAGVEPPEVRFHADTTAGNHRIVRMVQEIMHPRLP